MTRGKKSILATWSEYLALRAVTGILHAFSVRENLRTAAGVGTLFGMLSPTRRKRTEDNIRRSFPEFSELHVRRVAEQSLQHMFQVFMVDSLVMPRLVTPDTWPEYVILGDVDPLVDRLIRRQPTILVTGHFGNWEMLGFTIATAGFHLDAVARPLDNELINRLLLSIREQRGMRIITKWGAGPLLQKTLRSGGRVGFIADQNAGEQGLFVPFFGRLASSYKSIGLLAMRYRVPIIVGAALRDGGPSSGRFKFSMSIGDVITPEDWDQFDDPLYYITARYNRALEQMIRSAPEQYLWIHRRWKSRPKFEIEGKPMPDKFLRRLRGLPWMSDDQIDRLRSQ